MVMMMAMMAMVVTGMAVLVLIPMAVLRRIDRAFFMHMKRNLGHGSSRQRTIKDTPSVMEIHSSALEVVKRAQC
jgi:hypothetical protein